MKFTCNIALLICGVLLIFASCSKKESIKDTSTENENVDTSTLTYTGIKDTIVVWNGIINRGVDDSIVRVSEYSKIVNNLYADDGSAINANLKVYSSYISYFYDSNLVSEFPNVHSKDSFSLFFPINKPSILPDFDTYGGISSKYFQYDEIRHPIARSMGYLDQFVPFRIICDNPKYYFVNFRYQEIPTIYKKYNDINFENE